MTDYYQLSKQAVRAAIPDFEDLPLDAAMRRFDEAIASGQLTIMAISYSPSIDWSMSRHVKQTSGGCDATP